MIISLRGRQIHDVGCNVGLFCRVLPLISNKANYFGYDISETYIELTRQRFPHLSFQILDIATGMPEQQADVTIISATLEHIEAWELALENILNSTKSIVLLRSFFGAHPVSDMYKKDKASSPYLVRQFTFEQVSKVAYEKGFITRFLRDAATDSVPQYLGCGITRTQYIATLIRE